MRKNKIIHILSHLPDPIILKYNNPEEYFGEKKIGAFHKIDYPPYWVGFFTQDHHVFAAQDLLLLTDDFSVECWRPYGYGIREPHSEIVNSITHKVFPAKRKNYPHIGTFTWSESLYNALLNEIEENNVIVNISVGHAWFHIKLMLKLRKSKHKFGMVAIHRSGGFKHIFYNHLPYWKRAIKFYYHLESLLDLWSLRYADHYFIGAMPEAKYLEKNHPEISSSFFMEGINFKNYRVLNNSRKKQLRESLGLPVNGKIMIAYGNWKSQDYGYQYLLETYGKIKTTSDGNDLHLIMIGGDKTQDLYDAGINVGAIMIERVPKHIFINYLEASDFFLQTSFSWGFIKFAGFGTAMIEALACGLPIISGNIIHFPGNLQERNQIGLDAPRKNELYNKIIYLFKHSEEYKNCREIAFKYYDLSNTRQILLNKYKELHVKYFSTK